MRILLIEDDRRLLESLKFQLEKEDFTVDACTTGDDGLYFVLQGAYDLVILDRMLPGMDGISLLRRLRREGGAVPVILLTALGELEHKIEGLDAGADDYIVKPFAFEELMARIRSIGRRPQSWEQHETYTVGDLRLEPREKRLEGPGRRVQPFQTGSRSAGILSEESGSDPSERDFAPQSMGTGCRG